MLRRPSPTAQANAADQNVPAALGPTSPPLGRFFCASWTLTNVHPRKTKAASNPPAAVRAW